MTSTEVTMWYQNLINTHARTLALPLITVDGAWGPKTREAATSVCYALYGVRPASDALLMRYLTSEYCVIIGERAIEHRGAISECGPIPNPTARCSTFGGPNDLNDRCEGQANISSVPRPCDLTRYTRLCAAGLFRADALTLTEWPVTTDAAGHPRRAGTSWALDPQAFYCAMRWSPSLAGKGYANDNLARVLVLANDHAVVCYCSDYGPAVDTQCDLDLSPGAFQALGLAYRGVAQVYWTDLQPGIIV